MGGADCPTHASSVFESRFDIRLINSNLGPMYKFVVLLSSSLLLISCQKEASRLTKEDLKEVGEISFVSRDFESAIYQDREGEPQGLEYDLIQSYSSYAGVKPKIMIADNISEVLMHLRAGSAHIAAAGLTITESRAEEFLRSRGYQEIEEVVACQSKFKLKKPGELSAVSILVEANSSYVESLKRIQKKHPKVKWETTEEYSSHGILRLIDDDKAECTLIDSNLFKVFRRYYPSARLQFSLDKKKQLGWLMAENQKELKKSVDTWIDRITVSGELKRLIDKHYGFSDRFDAYDLKKYRERINSRLPKYRKLFKEAGKKYNFDWKLLAAVSYQESHWDPQAVSPTGVTGLMMLTQNTAEAMGVKDRTDPRQSVMGGAKYLRSRVQRVPSYIDESDRVWMALAAYNVGFGHLTDARAIAAILGLNPNRWLDVRTALPRLANKKYNRLTRYGYARGIEPVIYVRRIRDYYDILEKEM